MKNKIKLIACLLMLGPWLGGWLCAQNIINVNFDNGFPANATSDYSDGTANNNCPQDAFWVSDNMNTSCHPDNNSGDGFPDRTGNGNFMTVNSNNDNNVPGNGIVYSQAVNNWNGSVDFSINATHRFGSGGGDYPPAPITIDFRANNQTLFTFTIPLTTDWMTFSESNLNIPNNTTNISLVQTGGCWNCDYAIDDIMICPYAVADFDFLNSNAVYKDEFCYGEEVFIDGWPSQYETNHWFGISQLDANGNAVNWCTPSWQGSSINIVSLNDVVAAAGCNMTFEPGYTYRVKLAVGNDCTNWDEIVKTFSVVCCDTGPYAFEPCFDWTASSSGNDYTFAVTDYEGYDDLDVSHDWYVFASDDPNGPYTPFDHHSGHIFGWSNFQSGTFYTIIHQITTPCGEFCCAVQIYVNEDFNRGSSSTTSDCDVCLNDPCSFIDDWSPPACDITAPTGLKCSYNAQDQLILSWNPVAGAVAYKVYITTNDPECCRSGEPGVSLIPVTVQSNSFIPTAPNGCWSWSVEAICPDGTTAKSSSYCMNKNTKCFTADDPSPTDDPIGPIGDDSIGPIGDDPIGPTGDDPIGPTGDDPIGPTDGDSSGPKGGDSSGPKGGPAKATTANKGEQTQLLENGFKAYPNPTTDLFYIDLLTNDTDFESINIYNVNAQLIEQIEINSANNSNTYQWTPKAELPNGIYVISLSGSNKTIQQRVLLMR